MTTPSREEREEGNGPGGHESLLLAYVAFLAEIDNPVAAGIGSSVDTGELYAYAKIAAELAVVRPALARHGLMLKMDPRSRAGEVGIQATLKHPSGEETFETVWMPAGDTPQSRKTAYTFARKTAIEIVCCIAGEDDDGTTLEIEERRKRAAKPPAQPKPAGRTGGSGAKAGPKKASTAQVKRIDRDCELIGITRAQLAAEVCGAGADPKALTDAQASACIDALVPRVRQG